LAKVLQNGQLNNSADVVWNASQWPVATVSGRGNPGSRVSFGDIFPFTDPGPYNALTQANQRGAGYVLGHEWGHYYYGLYDEYVGRFRCNSELTMPWDCDIAVPNSVMNRQWNATNGDFNWVYSKLIKA
jgi:hypothetical protein